MSRLDQHISVVRNKLALLQFVKALAGGTLLLAAAVAVGVVVDRLVQFYPPRPMWFIGGGALVVVIGSFIYAYIHRPAAEAAAIAIDQQLGLKEKFSTALYARPLRADPFARAAVNDAEATAAGVNLHKKFPLVFPRMGFYAVGMAAIVLMLNWWLPNFDLSHKEEQHRQQAMLDAKKAEAQHIVERALATVNSYPRSLQNDPAVQLAKRDLENLLQSPAKEPERTTRSALKALQDLNEAVKEEVKNSSHFATVKSDEKLLANLTLPADQQGPVADVQRDMAKGDMGKAVEDLQKTVNNLPRMSPAEQKKAADQMKNLANQLQQMAQNPAQQQQMQQQLQKMGATPQQAQQLAKTMQQAAAGNPQAQQQLQQLQQQVQQQMNNGQGATPQQKAQMQQAMKQMQAAAGSQQQAAQMAQAAQQMAQAMQQGAQQASQPGQQPGQQQQAMAQAQQQMQQQMDQMDAMQKDAEQVAAAQQAGGQAAQDAADQLSNNPGSQSGNKSGQSKGQGSDKTGQWQQGDPKGAKGNGMGGPGVGNGGQANKQVAPFGIKQEVAPVQDNENGRILASTFVKAGTVKGESKAGLQSVAKAAMQDVTDEVDEQSVSKESQRVVKDYFETMQKAQ